jgi:hypothetical protein
MEGITEDQCNFGVLSEVTIQEVTDTSVSFSARSASQSGGSDESLLRTFTVPLTEVYATPIVGAPVPVQMAPGAIGSLFLSREGWKATTPDGFGIYGADQAIFKWPLCAAAPARLLSQLAIVPTSISVHGHLQGETAFFDLELVGPEAAESQDIVWRGADYIELRLSEAGARRLHLQPGQPGVMTVKAWPTRIVVKGSPTIDPSVSGEVDILDSELADSMQHLAFATPGAPVTLSLTQDGLGAFHVTPHIVAELSNAVGRTPALNAT